MLPSLLTLLIGCFPRPLSTNVCMYEGKSVSKVPYCTSLLHFSPPNETVNSAAYQATLKKLKRAV